MHKNIKLISLILALILVFSLCACGSAESAAEKVVNTYTEAAKAYDLEKMKSCLADTGSQEGSQTPGAFDADLIYVMKSWLAKMEYSIKETVVSGDTAKVTVAYTYIDAKDFMNSVYIQFAADINDRTQSGEQLTEEEILTIFLDHLYQAQQYSMPLVADADVVFTLTKTNRGWKISKLSESAEAVFSCNLTEFFNELM